MVLTCNKKGLAHSNWIVHLEPCRRKKSLTEESISICVEHERDVRSFISSPFFPPRFSEAPSAIARFQALSSDHVSILHLFFPPPSSCSFPALLFFSSCTQKIACQYTVCLPPPPQKKNKNLRLEPIIDREICFPQLPWRGCPFNCSVCLSAS